MCFRMGLLVFGGQLVQGLEPLGLTRLNRRKIIVSFGVGLLVLASAVCRADPRTTPNCQKVVLLGEVNEGQKWSGRIGEGWVFRIIPIQPAQANFSGWDPVVDRDKAAGFPDALFLATPLYDSIDEHEVGTTFELRAQDAIGWNPRSFHLLTDPALFRTSQQHFQHMHRNAQPGMPLSAPAGKQKPASTGAAEQLDAWLTELLHRSSAGQFRILDARLAPGTSDAAPFAENWALALPRTPHTIEPVTGPSSAALGELHWLRFSVTLWLPAAFKSPPELHAVRAACAE